jgi:uncharacterized membrane protein YeaQ/YmgE (transglycosylase-associated protein family)
MANSDSEYPFHQPRRSRHDPFDADTEADDDLGQGRTTMKPPTPRYQTRGPLHQRNAPMSPELPPHHLRNTLIIGIIAGIVGALQGIIITLANAATYNQAKGVAQSNMPLGLAGTLVGLACLTFFINLLIYFITGYITGKIAVSRRMGFLAGFVASAIASIIGYLVHQLPQYPDNSNTAGFQGGLAGILSGFVGALILLVIIALIAGGISYLGARIATRGHVYYTGYED